MAKTGPADKRSNSGRFTPGNTLSKGRPKGAQNRATVEAKAFWTKVVTDPTYQRNLQKRFNAGTVPPAVETMAWYYAAGKPKERVELGADKTLADLVLEAVNGPRPDPPKV